MLMNLPGHILLKCGNIFVFRISVCNAATPFTAKLPTIARFAMRTDLPSLSLIIDKPERIF